MGVAVDQEADRQPVLRGPRQGAVGLADLGIDQRGLAGVGAAQQVTLAATSGDLLEEHEVAVVWHRGSFS